MPVTVKELVRSRQGPEDNRLLYYRASGSTDDADIIAAVLAAAPPTHNGLPRRGIVNTDAIDGDKWDVTVQYGNDTGGATSADPGEAVLLSWRTTGSTQHLTNSKETIVRQGATGEDAEQPDFEGAIGVSDSGPAGVDWPVPSFAFVVRKKFQPAEITSKYLRNLIVLTGTTNDADWSVTVTLPNTTQTLTLSFARCEVVFDGAEAPEPQNDGTVVISFNFRTSPNVSEFIAAPNIPHFEKLGWHYVWLRYRLSEVTVGEDPDNKVVVSKPVAAYCERIADEGDYSLLNLPA